MKGPTRGTSMGTVSAASVAARLKRDGPDGVVLKATVTETHRQSPESVTRVRLGDIRVPALVVHHKRDACRMSPYGGAADTLTRLTQAPKRELLTFDGADPSRSEPCEAHSYHAEVVSATAGRIRAASSAR